MPDDYKPEVPSLLQGALSPDEQSRRVEAAERNERRLDRLDEQSFRRNQRWTNQLLVFAAIVTGGIGIWQGYLTRQSINVASRQAQAAENANRQAKDAADKAEKSDAIATQARREQEEHNRESFRETLRQNQLDQRAWVSVGKANINVLAPEKNVEIEVIYLNVGKSTATDVSCRTVINITNDDSEPYKLLFSKPWDKSKVTKTVMFPQGTLFDKLISGQTLTPESFTEIADGRRKIYVSGEVFYTDIFKARHHTEFCELYDARQKYLVGCKDHNSVS